MFSRISLIVLGAATVLLGGCGKNWEPGVKAIEQLAPAMEKNLGDCMMGAKNFGEEANKHGEALLNLPSSFGKDFKGEVATLKEKFGGPLEAPCTKIVDGAKQCRMDGAGNISGNGQHVIDICKAIKGVDGKL